MFCTNCGNFNPDGTQTCTSCGTPLKQPTSETPLNQTNYQPYTPQESYSQTPEMQAPAFRQVESEGTPGKGAGIASLILGIISLALFCIPVFPAIVALVGMIFGIVSISKSGKAGKKSGLGIAGLICSIIGIVIGGLYILGLVGAVVQELSGTTNFYY